MNTELWITKEKFTEHRQIAHKMILCDTKRSFLRWRKYHRTFYNHRSIYKFALNIVGHIAQPFFFFFFNFRTWNISSVNLAVEKKYFRKLFSRVWDHQVKRCKWSAARGWIHSILRYLTTRVFHCLNQLSQRLQQFSFTSQYLSASSNLRAQLKKSGVLMNVWQKVHDKITE